MYNLGEFQKLFIKRFKNNGAYIGLKEIKNEKETKSNGNDTETNKEY